MSRVCSFCKSHSDQVYCEQCSVLKLNLNKEIFKLQIKDILDKNMPKRKESSKELYKGLILSEKELLKNQEQSINDATNKLNSLKDFLKKVRESKNMMLLRKQNSQAELNTLKEDKKEIKSKLETIISDKKVLMSKKIQALKRIFSIHHSFPNLTPPLQLKIISDKFFETINTKLIESQKYYLDLPHFNLLSEDHLLIIGDMFSRTGDLLSCLAKIYHISLPVKTYKDMGVYYLTFHHDPSKLYELQLEKNVAENNLIKAISLLFTNFLYICRLKGLKLYIPVDQEQGKNDILNMGLLLDYLCGYKIDQNGLDKVENFEFNLDIIDMRRRSSSLEDEFEIIDDNYEV